MAAVKKGMTLSRSRSVTEEDVLQFAQLSGDKGRHHLERDKDGRLLAHGLLTATLPTQIGGSVNFIAKTMEFHFRAAVYSGDTLTCDGVVQSVIEQSTRLKVAFAFTVKNQRGEVVLDGLSSGMILK
jgi:acyl dehydratase